MAGDTLCRRWEEEHNTRGVGIGNDGVMLVTGLDVVIVRDMWMLRRRIH